MTLIATDRSTQDGQPVELYQFTLDGTTTRYTNHPVDFTFDSNTYTSVAIERSEFKLSDQMSQDPVTITLSQDDSFAQQFQLEAPINPCTVNILYGHSTDADDDFVIQWKGRLMSAKTGNGQTELKFESIYTSLRRSGLRAKYQRNCRHAIYSTECGVNRASFSTAGTVGAVTGATVTVSAASGESDGYFSGGMLEDAGGALWYIVNHVGSTLLLSRASHGLAVSDSVTLYAGCPKDRTTCNTRFSNVANFGGFPWIPSKNPFNTSITGEGTGGGAAGALQSIFGLPARGGK